MGYDSVLRTIQNPSFADEYQAYAAGLKKSSKIKTLDSNKRLYNIVADTNEFFPQYANPDCPSNLAFVDMLIEVYQSHAAQLMHDDEHKNLFVDPDSKVDPLHMMVLCDKYFPLTTIESILHPAIHFMIKDLSPGVNIAEYLDKQGRIDGTYANSTFYLNAKHKVERLQSTREQYIKHLMEEDITEEAQEHRMFVERLKGLVFLHEKKSAVEQRLTNNGKHLSWDLILIKKYFQNRYSYLKDVLDELWHYKLELVRGYENSKTAPQAHHVFYAQLQEDFKKNQAAVLWQEIQENEEAGPHKRKIVELEQRYANDSSIYDYHLRMQIARVIMTWRMYLVADIDAMTTVSDTLKHNLTDYVNLVISLIEKPNTITKESIVKAHELQQASQLSQCTQDCFDKLLRVALKPRTHIDEDLSGVNNLRRTLLSDDDLYQHFPKKSREALSDQLGLMYDTLVQDAKAHPELQENANLLAQYANHMVRSVMYALDVDSSIDLHALKRNQAYIMRQPSFRFISPQTKKTSYNVIKCALMMGLLVATLAAVAFLTLSLTPQTTSMMAGIALRFAIKTHGLTALGSTLIAIPALLATIATAAVLKFSAPPAPMPNQDIIDKANHINMSSNVAYLSI